MKACLAVRPPRPSPARAWLRPVVVVVLAVGVYLAVTAAFRVSGHWHGAVSEGEYAERLRDIDSPAYTHVGGLAAAEPAPGGGALARSHGAP